VTSDTPTAVLVAARTILDRPEAVTSSAWARSTALLTRQALEAALGDFWRSRAPGMEDCPLRAQLVALQLYVPDPHAARLAHHTWASLSHACHHHAYDLAPTASELRAWLDTVAQLVDGLDAAKPGAPVTPRA
jgi:hypothetical protein